MDVITMGSIYSLVKRLGTDFPQYSFVTARDFWWSAAKQTIFYNPETDNAVEYCLHELSHALLAHKGYEFDIDLIKLERDAWEYAQVHIAVKYGLSIDDDLVQNNLETYREWLHARSKCPECEASGIQTKSQYYHCLACDHRWRVNEARLCALRRYSVTQK